MIVSRPALALGLLVVAPLTSAATPVGKWTGQIMVKTPPMPANVPPQQRAMVAQMLAGIAKTRITLDMKANKTYSSTISGGPMQKKPQTEGGKWSQAGNTITVTQAKGGAQTQTMVLSADAKTMTMILPKGQGKIVFRR